jgi:hypothetical protein
MIFLTMMRRVSLKNVEALTNLQNPKRALREHRKPFLKMKVTLVLDPSISQVINP